MGKIPSSIEKTVRKFIEAASQRCRIKEAYLYGSQAKGMASAWSDIDIALSLKISGLGPWKRKTSMRNS